jgi:hypothetical protein
MTVQNLFKEDLGERRYDLDWVRIGAFMLLILYHVGMYYVTWDWHVKSPHASRRPSFRGCAVSPNDAWQGWVFCSVFWGVLAGLLVGRRARGLGYPGARSLGDLRSRRSRLGIIPCVYTSSDGHRRDGTHPEAVAIVSAGGGSVTGAGHRRSVFLRVRSHTARAVAPELGVPQDIN